MSTVLDPRAPELDPRGLHEPAEESPFAAAPRRPRRRLTEGTVLFVGLFLIYAVIGCRVVVGQNVVVFDSLSHLAHAYFAIYNDPPKLAAIGFEWPPMMTLVFLPLAAIKPLATSLVAIPLTSAAFGAALICVLNRTLTLLGLTRWMRLPVLLLFGLNPLVVFYASNGMAEIVYLTFLATGVHFFVAWYVSREPHRLALSGAAFSIAMLTRYEMIFFAGFVALALLLVLIHRRATREESEGTLVLFGAPLVYGLGAWFFFNWLIVGNPFFWIERQAEKNVTVGRGDVSKADLPSIPVGDVLHDLLELNLKLFPLVLLLVPLLLLVAARRRDPMSLILAGLMSLNALMTTALIINSHDPSLLQLRYNMRALPIAIAGIGWLCWTLRGRPRARMAAWVASLAVLAAGIPVVWSTMETYPYQFQESAFVAAVKTGEDQDGTKSVGGYDVGVGDMREMADYIEDHGLEQPNSIFTDDESVTQGVMLISGRPDAFVDRIDIGDEKWQPILADPWGEVPYLMVSKGDFAPDQIQECYPGSVRGTMPGTELIHENPSFALLSVDEKRPKGAGGAWPEGCPLGG